MAMSNENTKGIQFQWFLEFIFDNKWFFISKINGQIVGLI
jgi:hypothetical protein